MPAIILVYFLFMAWQGRDILLVQGDYLRFYGTVAAELFVIVLLSIFLRKKYQMKQAREAEMARLAKEREECEKEEAKTP